jgi:HPt (histidine-containing phosphotransfer) domain-containing protein
LSAGAMLEEQQEAAAAGMNDFVSKPFNVKRLVTSIRGLLADVPASEEGPSSLAVADTHWPRLDGVTTQDAFDRTGGDWKMYIGLLEQLLREHLNDATASDTMEADETLQSLRRRMHKLKGAAGTLGLNEVYRLAADAEFACSAGDNSGAIAAVNQVDKALRRVHASAMPHLTKLAQAMDGALDTSILPLKLQDLEELRDLFHRQSIEALDKFETLQTQIRPLMNAAEFKQLQNYIQELQFAQATNLLAPLLA